MANRTLTKAQAAKHALLCFQKDMASDRIYAAAHPRCDISFSECVKIAAPSVVTGYCAARDELADFERRMVEDGRAHFITFGLFRPY